MLNIRTKVIVKQIKMARRNIFLNIILIEVFENYDNLNIKLFHYSVKKKKKKVAE